MQDNCAIDFNYLNKIGLDKPTWGVTPFELNDFVGPEWVADWLDELWCENYSVNKNKGIPKCSRSWEGRGKAVVFVGASPAVLKNIDTLKTLGDDFIIVACNGIYGKLLQEGVRVDYIFALEARPHIAGDFTIQDEHAELIVSPFVAPAVLEAWKGKTSMYYLGGGRKYSAMLETDTDIGGGNALNTAACWAYKYLNARDFIFIGMSFCYYDDYYFDGRTTEHVCKFDEKSKNIKAIDMYGKMVQVTPSQLMFKTWLENFVAQAKDAHFINATEDGILGVVPEILSFDGTDGTYTLKYLPWISIIPFNMAVDSYRRLFMEAKQNGSR